MALFCGHSYKVIYTYFSIQLKISSFPNIVVNVYILHIIISHGLIIVFWCFEMSRNDDSGNVYPQALHYTLQEEDYTSTHQSSCKSQSSPPTSGVEYCSLPHLPYWQRVRSITNTTTNKISSPSLDDGISRSLHASQY